MKKIAAICIAAILLAGIGVSAQSRTLIGEGQGEGEDEAKQFALQDLGSQIEVRVQSIAIATESYAEDKNSNEYKAKYNATVKSTVDLPILGVTYQVHQEKNKFLATATLAGTKVLPLYKTKMIESAAGIDTAVRLLPGHRGKTTEEDQILALISQVEQLEKYRSVAISLGAAVGEIPQSPVKIQELKSRLAEIQDTLDTIEKAARKLTKGIDQKNIYIYPATAPGSSEITPFAAALRNAMQGSLAAMDDPKKAGLILRGSYEFAGTGIEVMYRLLRLDGTVVKTTNARILPEGFAGLETKPSTLGIDQLIKQGLAVSSDFRMEASTNRGKRDLLFQVGEEVEILVKLSRPGYFYAVEHVKDGDNNSSLLLQVAPDAKGNRQFIYFVNADDVNKWISIGKFNVTPPVGIERLQFIASSADLVDRLPGYSFDSANGNYVISGKTEDAINQVRTRGLQNKRKDAASSSQSGGEGTETFLTFTTMNAE